MSRRRPPLKPRDARADAGCVKALARERVAWGSIAAVSSALIGWIGLQELAWNDFFNEASASATALLHGDVSAFFAHAPVYGGSLLMRAPFAFIATLWGGGELALAVTLALPCLLAGIALGLWLVERMGREGRSFATRLLVLVLCTANPITLLALEIGHPEELLGAVLCVAAVLLASRGRWAWAALALAIAIANKQWAVLALGPVLIALPACRVRCMALACSVAGALTAPFLLFKPLGYVVAAKAVATSSGTLFQPWQIWWFLGSDPPAGTHLPGVPRGARIAPGWVSQISHPLIVLIAVPLTLALWLQLRRRATGSPIVASAGRALLLLTLLLLLRCMLDPWDNVYYPLPFVLALLTWETAIERRPPVLAAISSVAVLADNGWITSLAAPDDQAALFIAYTLPLALYLAARLYAPGWRRRRVDPLRSAGASAPSSSAAIDAGVTPRTLEPALLAQTG